MAPRIKFIRIYKQLVPLRIHIDRQLMIRLESLGIQPPELTQPQITTMIEALQTDLVNYVTRGEHLDGTKSKSNEDDQINDYIVGGQKYQHGRWVVILKRSDEILGRSMLKELRMDINEERDNEGEDNERQNDEKKNLHVKYRPSYSREIIDVYVQDGPI